MWRPVAVLEQLTPGIRNALDRGRVRSRCACGFPLPVYPGRYPAACPECGRPFAREDAGGGADGTDAADSPS